MPPRQLVPPTSSSGTFNTQNGMNQPASSPIAQGYPQSSGANPFQQHRTVPHADASWPAQPQASQTGGPITMTTVPYNTLARIISEMSTMQRTVEERLTSIEDSMRQTNGIPERLERVENDLKASRDQNRQDSTNVIAYLDRMARLTSQRLQMVGERMERVESSLGPNHFNNPSLLSSTELQEADKLAPGNSVMEKLKNMECLLMELLEKANDPDATKSDIVRHEAGVNTETPGRADAAMQSLPPPERHEVAVGEPLKYTNPGTEILAGELEEARGSSRYGNLRMGYPGIFEASSSTQGISTSIAPEAATLLQAGLRPATWREDQLSDLSSRSTSPGMTIDELRQLLHQKEQAYNQTSYQKTQSSATPSDAPHPYISLQQIHPYISLQQIHPPPPQIPPATSSPVASRSSAQNLSPSSRAVSVMLEEPRERSSSIDYAGCRDSVERLFDDDDDDVVVMTSPKASNTSGYVAASGEFESEEETGPEQRRMSPPTSARVPARRRRSPSIDSLSSLSTLPSSSSTRQDSDRCDPLPMPISRPRGKKRRRTEPSGSTRATKKKANNKTTQRITDSEDKSGKWQVIYGYNGPCKWPKTADHDESCKSLMKCDDCDCWYHWGCVGVDGDDPRATSEDVPFSCPPCELSREMHGIARKVQQTREGIECARPGCTLNLATGEFFLERIIGRYPHVGEDPPVKFIWLFKWTDYPPIEATWEVDDAFPSGRDKYIEEFEEAAYAQGLPVDDPSARLLLREAREGGWNN
ncbi:hypothetical protein BDY19DRAFT_939773 [Irpex rosettiformis]|uniref:Uncharacterized protein n=1 Tax=Irpex rosettiformis TaxID=378272 RepID=A0ACB8U7Z4_9APHY|nr:hypothetical protein BDY19DRAFT_939773 [Irpex rosettiformis]